MSEYDPKKSCATCGVTYAVLFAGVDQHHGWCAAVKRLEAELTETKKKLEDLERRFTYHTHMFDGDD